MVDRPTCWQSIGEGVMKKPEGEVLEVLENLKEQIQKIRKKRGVSQDMRVTLTELEGYVEAYLKGEKSPPHHTVVRDVLNRVYINYMSDEDFDEKDKKVLEAFKAVEKKIEAVPAQAAALTSAQKPPLPPRRFREPLAVQATERSTQQNAVATSSESNQAHKKDILKALDELENNGRDWLDREGSKVLLGAQNAKLRYQNGGSDVEAVQKFLETLNPKSVPGVGVKYISSHQKDIAAKFMNTEGIKEALKDPKFREDFRASVQGLPQQSRQFILKELPPPVARAEVLDIKKPERKAQGLLSVDDAIHYLLGDATRHVGAKGDARALLETAIYLIRKDLYNMEVSPEVTSARDAMQKLDKQFRESVESNPLNKEKNNATVRECLAEIKANQTLEKCYANEEKRENSAKK